MKNLWPHSSSVLAEPEDRVLREAPKKFEKVRAPRIADLQSPSEILAKMSDMTIGARALGDAADVLVEMFKECDFVVLTLSGAASVGKLDYIIAELIDRGLIQCVVCTGAVVTHGCSYEMGGQFFKVREVDVDQDDDTAMYNRGYNRVYDTVELEKSLEKTGDLIREILESWPGDSNISSAELHRAMGSRLCDEHSREDGLLHAAFRNEIPVITPAFTDSEVGLSFAEFILQRAQQNKPHPVYDGFKDLDCYGCLYSDHKTHGILTLGGGVPRNWAQQIGPFLDSLLAKELIKKAPERFKYAVRICPEPTEWGGLSGCTYSEGISWGKFIPEKEGGRYAEVYSDYTAVFPLLISGVLERL